MKKLVIFCVFLACGAIFANGNSIAKAAEYVWLEAENPAKIGGVEKFNSWEHEYFSGKWLHLSIDANKIDTEIQGEAVTLRYDFELNGGGVSSKNNDVPSKNNDVSSANDEIKSNDNVKSNENLSSKSQTFEIWNRVGFEYVRSPFDWRIDGGDWKTAKPDDLTIDLMEVGFWCEIAWLKLGDATLANGKHSLEIRLNKQKNKDGKPERILYASDCFCLYNTENGKFEPYSKFKPDENHRTEKDKTAAEHVFKINESRSNELKYPEQLNLNGVWEICRDDEYLPEPVIQPISRLPQTSRWSAIETPGDKNTLRPDLQFAHRVWYRTKFETPKNFDKHSAYIEFPQNNLNTTVYVNGKLCGFNKNPFAKFHIDISKALKPGINEIYVGIRDAWYARTEKAGDPMKLRKTFNIPKKYFGDGFQDLVYPIWNHPQSGILLTPTIYFMPTPVYLDDVFIKTLVAKKEIELQMTLKNTSDNPQEVTVHNGYTNITFVDDNGRAIKQYGTNIHIFDRSQIKLEANSEKTVTVNSKYADNVVLWTPERPQNYTLKTIIVSSPEKSYSVENEFGFREWSIDGKNFLLNGVPFHGWADTFDKTTKEDWLKFYRETNQRFMRFWGVNWKEMPPDEALNFFDRNGVIVRRSGIFDGEAIGYNVIENDAEIRAINKAENPAKEEIKMDLFRNWRDQMVAQVKAERNHPSIMLWSMENEILYINCINLYGGLMDQFEDEILKTSDAIKNVDPTRPSMTDGGGAAKNNGLAVQGDHYIFDDFTKYPDLAYEAFPEGGGRGRWKWDEKRPRFIGEDFYVNGFNPSDFAVIGGEETFGGRTAAKRGVGILYKMLMEGYRWNEYGAWQFWVDQNRASDQYSSNASIAVFCKEYDWTFESGKQVKRTFKIFNDSQKDENILFTANYQPKNKTDNILKTWQKQSVIPAGKNLEFSLDLAVPEIEQNQSETKRDEGTLVFLLHIQNKEKTSDQWKPVFSAQKKISVLDLKDCFNSFAMHSTPPQKVDANSSLIPTAYGQFSLLVYDPKNSVTDFFDKNKIVYQKLKNLENIPQGKYGKTILLIGKDAIPQTESESPRIAEFAAKGNGVVVLEQQFPLHGKALPCVMETAENEGRTAFIENETHPAFQFLKQKDFFTWADGHVVYRNAYMKPQRGARSLLQCGNRLANSAVVEVPVGEGIMILSQTLVGEKLEKSVTAKLLLTNLIQYVSSYQLRYTPVFVCTRDLEKRLLSELDAMKLKYSAIENPISTLKNLKQENAASFSKATILLSASPQNLQTLLENQKTLQEFYNAGGVILLHGLTPDGLERFNQLVGIEHQIREFRRERVAFPPKRNLLLQGLSLSDVAMSSGEKMFGWANDEYVASDTYSYVVDLEDVAPFAAYENDFNRMMSNGMLSADGWPYIVNLPAPDSPPLDFSLKYTKEQELCEVTWTGNTFYYPVTKFGLFFDGKSENAKFFDVAPNTEPQTFTIDPPIRGKNLTLRLADWTVLPDKGKVTGLDNIELKAKRSGKYYQSVNPMLNIGAMVQYRLALPSKNSQSGETNLQNIETNLQNIETNSPSGGIVLCNLKFQEKESVPENAIKKRNIFATILRNLDAQFAEEEK